ncbi:MAG: NF038122 family metalloprotease, partial [Pirellulaceae bacterium]
MNNKEIKGLVHMATRKNRPDLLGKRGQMKRQERRGNRARDSKRKLLLETLEDRRLLAVGPQLIGIQPNDGDLLPFDDPNHIRNTAPSELVFRFDENQVFTSDNLDGIQITRSKLDGVFTWATVQTDFNTGNAVTVEFRASKLGEDQNGISLGFSKRDQGGAGLPTISVIGDRIDVSLNTNTGNETTAEQLIDALSANAEAGALIRAEVVSGSADADIATPALSYSPLILGGAGDIVVNPGYIGVGDSSNEVIVRFSETLPDDLYRIDVYGEGLNAFRNSRGIAFGDLTEDNLDNGSDFSYQFDLDLGAKVISVVPQPVLRDADGDLSQARDQVLVYFNDDDLDPVSAENPIFYQLIYTSDNAELFDSDTSDGDTSDVVFNPVSVQYNAATDAALLTFAADLEQLPDPRNGGAPIGAGTYRLRVGTDEAAPRNPSQLNVGNPGDSYDTAMDLSGNWDTGRIIVVNGNATAFQHGQTFTVTNEAGDVTTYEFNDQGAGVTVGNEAVDIDTSTPTTAMGIANAIAGAINGTAGFAVTAAATNPASGVQVTLDGDAGIELGTSLTGLGLSTQGIILHESISVADEGIANYPLDLPGGNTEPGHRDLSSAGDRHLSDTGADAQSGITTVFYNFRNHIGFIPGDSGQQPAYNNITEAQKNRSREIFEILSEKSGIQYVETPDFVVGAQNLLVATGDLRAIDPLLVPGPGDVIGLSGATAFGRAVIMDNAEDWNDEFAGSWFQTAMHEIGHQMGLLHTYELPPNTLMGEDFGLTYGTTLEPDFPGNHDVVHLQHLHRPESRDIDLYEFELHEAGFFTAEIVAERLRDFNESTDLLDASLALYQVRVELDPATGDPVKDGNGQLIQILDANGVEIKDLIAQNDDYFTKDSYLELELREGKYFVGVSASGNNQYDPAIENSGFNGKSEGAYDLRLNFRPSADRAITDADNPVDAFQPEIIPTAIDGDADGRPGGVYDFWFRVAAASGTEVAGEPRTIFVNKSSPTGGNGTLASPFNNIPAALNVDLNGLPLPSANPNAVQVGDILRIVGNPGDDNDIRTELDNRAYELGFDDLGVSLSDGSFLEIPKDVTVMVDSGSIFKMRRSWIGAGSTSPGALKDRSAGELQILGAPVVIDALGNVVPLAGSYDTATPLENLSGDAPERGVVHFTSYFDESLGLDTFSFATTPQPGDWGGLLIKRDIDNADRTRFSYEDNAIFLTHINNVDLQYGGGEVLIESVAQVIDPVEIVDGRPTVSYNVITQSRDAAIAASPDSFKESNFHSPEYQQEYQTSPFTVDYVRIGPDIHGNFIADNTTNGLSIRIETLTGEDAKELTVSARFDDTDIVHVLQENLAIDSNPGGPKMEIGNEPDLSLVTLTPQTLTDGNLPAGTHNYRMVFVDKNGNEGLASTATINRTTGGTENAIRLAQLLTPTDDFVARRLYRSTGGGAYELIATINQTDTEYVDKGITLNGSLDDSVRKLRPRFDARLGIDPNVILKIDGAHIMVEPGAQFIAEGRDGHEVIITSLLDDRYGTAGTYDTSNDGYVGISGVNAPQPGDWGGIYVAATSAASIDHSVISYGGGVTKIEGTFAGFNAIEIQQGEARIANTLFEFNAAGFGGQAPSSRYGRLFNEASVIFVRDAQPLIIDNTFRNNTDVDWSTNLAAISINVNAMDHQLKFDTGRSTGLADALIGYKDNHGPLIVGNMMRNNEINGLMVRGEVLTTQSIWDDTGIAHVLSDRIYIPDFHTYGGLRLQSAPNASLVIKMAGANAGFEATGRPIEINDRIGGHVQILGQPKSPVIITSLRDDTVGAGIQPNGDPLVDTNNDGTVAPVTSSSSRTNISFNFGPAMAANPAAMAEAQQAADYWGSLLRDPIDIVFDVDFATLTGGAIGTMSPTTAVLDYDTVLGAMVADATLSETIVGSIPDSASITVTGATANDTIAITRANALALGITQGLPAPTSQYGGGIIDGTMQIGDTFDNANPGIYDTVLHEIGHALGFMSSVGGSGNVSLTTLDLFRIAPGSSPSFGTTPRVMDQNAEHVFYDGGEFNPIGITTIAGLLVGEVPLTNGGDGNQPSHWKFRNLINNVYLGVMDPIDNPGADPVITANDIRAFGLIGWDVEIAGLAGPAKPGDWDTILLNQYSHDRNVDVAVEFEDRSVNAPGVNANALSAQFLGELAPNEKSGDENRRLGFEVHGFLSNPQDLDVYSFSGVAGTEVWVDFDKTTYAFDPIVELIDGNGTVLVRSVNTLEENDGILSLYEDSTVPNSAFTMQKVQPYNGKDFWAVNPRDPGLRLVLPGPADTRNTYHLRVRSNTKPADIHKLDAGLTSGAYQMQVRLRELDEIAGSVIRYANISYADTGITVYGQPVHSPLSGENYEIEVANGINDTRGGAQQLGNVMGTDRATLSVAGRLVSNQNGADTDWYSFSVDPQNTQSTLTSPWAWPVVIDLDYADGLSRANTVVSVFDSSGTLILHSTDSNVQEDRPEPLAESQVEDLNRGSVGAGDPFLGPVLLPPGQYFVAVTSQGRGPSALGAASTRIEPANSSIRVVEDHVDRLNASTAEDPYHPGRLFDGGSVVPWNLSDVGLYVMREDPTGILRSEMLTVNPYTGETAVEFFSPARGNTARVNFDVGDIVRQRDGTVHSFSLNLDENNPCAPRDDVNRFVELDPGFGTGTDLGWDAIETYQEDPANPGAAVRAHRCNNSDHGYGVNFNAIYAGGVPANTPPLERLLAVGNRGDFGFNLQNGVDWLQNIMFEFDPGTGDARHIGNDESRDPKIEKSWTNAWPVGRVVTGPELGGVNATDVDLNGRLIDQLNDGDTFAIDDGFSQTTFEFDFGPQVRQNIDKRIGETMRDGYFFVLDPNDEIDDDEVLYQFDTGAVINIFGNGQVVKDGTIVSINDDAGATFSFEFDSDPDPGVLDDPTATRIRFGAGTSALQMAGQLATAINGTNNFTVTAEAVVSRVTLTNDLAITVTHVSGDVDGVQVEGATGEAPVIEVKDVASLVDGDTFSVITMPGNMQHIFELDTDGTVSGSNIAVSFNIADTPEQVTQAIEQAVNGSFAVTGLLGWAGGPRVSINGANVQQGSISTLASVMEFESVEPPIQVEENSTTEEVAIATVTQVGISPLFEPSYLVDQQPIQITARIGFLGAEVGDFRGVRDPVWQSMNTFGGVLDPTHIPIELQVWDEAADFPDPMDPTFINILDGIATKTASVINANMDTVVAEAIGDTVVVTDGTIVLPPSSPLTATGQGPGGNITGLANVNGQIYGVSDEGGLYEIDMILSELTGGHPSLMSVDTQFVGTSAADLHGIQFQGLVAGPENVEAGKYSDMLFGIDTNGTIYAFDTDGVLQPIFLDGVTHVETGITQVRGLMFSNLDRNLFHITPSDRHQISANEMDVRFGLAANVGDTITIDERQFEVGHGITAIYDGTRGVDTDFNQSFHFGRGNVGGTARSYDFIGGAHGSIVSNEFSLRGFAAEDKPTLYFTYWSQTDGAQDRDTFRVWATDNNSDWSLLATNNDGAIQDDSTWRQVRTSLAGFAGVDNLRIRVDFDTTGDRNTGQLFDGELNNTGTELIAIDGIHLRDGQTYEIDGQVFEFESGFTIVAPSARALQDGDNFTVENAASVSVTFEFDHGGGVSAGNTPIALDDTDSGSDVATKIETVLGASGLGIVTHRNDERVNLEVTFDGTNDAVAVTNSTAVASFVEGEFGRNADPFTGLPNDLNAVVFVHEDMTSVDVADSMNTTMEANFYTPILVVEGAASYTDSDTFILDDSVNDAVTFEIEKGFILTLPAVGSTDIIDGDTLVFTDGTDTYTVEFDNEGTTTAGNSVVTVAASGEAMINVSNRLRDQINADVAGGGAAANLGLQAIVVTGGRVQIFANDDVTMTAPVPTNFVLDPTSAPGVGIDANNNGHVPVRIIDSGTFRASDVADAIRDAINNAALPLDITAAIVAGSDRRVQITHDNALNALITFTDNTGAITLEQTVTEFSEFDFDAIKQYEDIFWMVGYTVDDPGPLGWEEDKLCS